MVKLSIWLSSEWKASISTPFGSRLILQLIRTGDKSDDSKLSGIQQTGISQSYSLTKSSVSSARTLDLIKGFNKISLDRNLLSESLEEALSSHTRSSDVHVFGLFLILDSFFAGNWSFDGIDGITPLQGIIYNISLKLLSLLFINLRLELTLSYWIA